MTDTTIKNPRASFWQDRKVEQAAKVTTRRALEQDMDAKAPLHGRSVQKKVMARANWQPPHPWATDATT